MRILVTGAHSLIGQALARKLGEQGMHELILTETDTGDLRDLDYVKEITRGVDVVVHLAPIVMHLDSAEATLDLATRANKETIPKCGVALASSKIA